MALLKSPSGITSGAVGYKQSRLVTIEDLVAQYITWSPVLYKNIMEQTSGLGYYIDPVVGYYCPSVDELKNSENLKVTLYTTYSSGADRKYKSGSEYKFNGKEGQLPKLNVITTLYDEPELTLNQLWKPYEYNSIVRMCDVWATYNKKKVTFRFHNFSLKKSPANAKLIIANEFKTSDNLEFIKYNDYIVPNELSYYMTSESSFTFALNGEYIYIKDDSERYIEDKFTVEYETIIGLGSRTGSSYHNNCEYNENTRMITCEEYNPYKVDAGGNAINRDFIVDNVYGDIIINIYGIKQNVGYVNIITDGNINVLDATSSSLPYLLIAGKDGGLKVQYQCKSYTPNTFKFLITPISNSYTSYSYVWEPKGSAISNGGIFEDVTLFDKVYTGSSCIGSETFDVGEDTAVRMGYIRTLNLSISDESKHYLEIRYIRHQEEIDKAELSIKFSYKDENGTLVDMSPVSADDSAETFIIRQEYRESLRTFNLIISKNTTSSTLYNDIAQLSIAYGNDLPKPVPFNTDEITYPVTLNSNKDTILAVSVPFTTYTEMNIYTNQNEDITITKITDGDANAYILEELSTSVSINGLSCNDLIYKATDTKYSRNASLIIYNTSDSQQAVTYTLKDYNEDNVVSESVTISSHSSYTVNNPSYKLSKYSLYVSAGIADRQLIIGAGHEGFMGDDLTYTNYNDDFEIESIYIKVGTQLYPLKSYTVGYINNTEEFASPLQTGTKYYKFPLYNKFNASIVAKIKLAKNRYNSTGTVSVRNNVERSIAEINTTCYLKDNGDYYYISNSNNSLSNFIVIDNLQLNTSRICYLFIDPYEAIKDTKQIKVYANGVNFYRFELQANGSYKCPSLPTISAGESKIIRTDFVDSGNPQLTYGVICKSNYNTDYIIGYSQTGDSAVFYQQTLEIENQLPKLKKLPSDLIIRDNDWEYIPEMLFMSKNDFYVVFEQDPNCEYSLEYSKIKLKDLSSDEYVLEGSDAGKRIIRHYIKFNRDVDNEWNAMDLLFFFKLICDDCRIGAVKVKMYTNPVYTATATDGAWSSDVVDETIIDLSVDTSITFESETKQWNYNKKISDGSSISFLFQISKLVFIPQQRYRVYAPATVKCDVGTVIEIYVKILSGMDTVNFGINRNFYGGFSQPSLETGSYTMDDGNVYTHKFTVSLTSDFSSFNNQTVTPFFISPTTGTTSGTTSGLSIGFTFKSANLFGEVDGVVYNDNAIDFDVKLYIEDNNTLMSLSKVTDITTNPYNTDVVFATANGFSFKGTVAGLIGDAYKKSDSKGQYWKLPYITNGVLSTLSTGNGDLVTVINCRHVPTDTTFNVEVPVYARYFDILSISTTNQAVDEINFIEFKCYDTKNESGLYSLRYVSDSSKTPADYPDDDILVVLKDNVNYTLSKIEWLSSTGVYQSDYSQLNSNGSGYFKVKMRILNTLISSTEYNPITVYFNSYPSTNAKNKIEVKHYGGYNPGELEVIPLLDLYFGRNSLSLGYYYIFTNSAASFTFDNGVQPTAEQYIHSTGNTLYPSTVSVGTISKPSYICPEVSDEMYYYPLYACRMGYFDDTTKQYHAMLECNRYYLHKAASSTTTFTNITMVNNPIEYDNDFDYYIFGLGIVSTDGNPDYEPSIT